MPMLDLSPEPENASGQVIASPQASFLDLSPEPEEAVGGDDEDSDEWAFPGSLCHNDGLPCRGPACVMWRPVVPPFFRPMEIVSCEGDEDVENPAFHCAEVRNALLQLDITEGAVIAQFIREQQNLAAQKAAQEKADASKPLVL